MNKTLSTFKFDETTTLQTKKQYDRCLQFWSKRYNEIINAYFGSLFTGHCTSDQLLEHYQTFVSRLGLDWHYLLHIGMDGPNVNLAFEKKLRQYFEDEMGSSFLSLGSCSPHSVHTAFRKGLEALSFDLDSFYNDIHFFSQAFQCQEEGLCLLRICYKCLGSICYETYWNQVAFNKVCLCPCSWTMKKFKGILTKVFTQGQNIRAKNSTNK